MPWEIILWSSLTFAVIVGVILLIVSIKSAITVRKRREELKEVHTELQIGTKVICCGGVYARVVSINNDDETVEVEVSKGTTIKISRYAIQQLVK